MLRPAVVALAAGLLLPGAATAAPAKVAIEADKYDPAVVVIPPGGQVEWRNKDTVPRGLTGDVNSSGPIRPGETYKRRFRRLGQYDYRDSADAQVRGTVIVAIAGGRRQRPGGGGGSGDFLHKYRAALRLDLRETWKFRDSVWGTEHPCSGQVGDGSRTVRFTANFPKVDYQRGFGNELFLARSKRFRIDVYREKMDSKVSTNETPEVDCGDGTSDRSATQPSNCNATPAGKPTHTQLSFSPKIAQSRFQFTSDTRNRAENCGPHYPGGLATVGVNEATLPLSLLGGSGNLFYESGRTSPATATEVRALRSGRAVTVERTLDLHFTTDCCSGFNTGPGGIYLRVGAIFTVKAKLTIRFRPR
jgi:plastocyanin